MCSRLKMHCIWKKHFRPFLVFFDMPRSISFLFITHKLVFFPSFSDPLKVSWKCFFRKMSNRFHDTYFWRLKLLEHTILIRAVKIGSTLYECIGFINHNSIESNVIRSVIYCRFFITFPGGEVFYPDGHREGGQAEWLEGGTCVGCGYTEVIAGEVTMWSSEHSRRPLDIT